MTAVTFTAEQIATLTEPVHSAEHVALTREQKQVIEEPMGLVTVVSAGAGSGKTFTIALRVVWLIANGFLRANEVLGLTFTVKAAGELAERIEAMLENLLTNLGNANRSVQEEQLFKRLRENEEIGSFTPLISTYNSFAHQIVNEYGIYAGLQEEMRVIDEAEAWQMARDTCREAEDLQLQNHDESIDRLAGYVLTLDHEIADSLQPIETIENDVKDQLASFTALPPYGENEKHTKEKQKKIERTLFSLELRTKLIQIVKRYRAKKLANAVIEFADQFSLAHKTVNTAPTAKEELQNRYRMVLLDEVQDTSAAQIELFGRLFSENSLLAVGDPNQAIYAWRGATVRGILQLHENLNTSPERRSLQTLGTSFRNSKAVLRVASSIAKDLPQLAAKNAGKLKAKPDAPEGECVYKIFETLPAQAENVAAHLAKRLQSKTVDKQNDKTAAILFRKRKHMGVFAAALREKGLAYQIVGVGGLLETPEITDIVSALHVLWSSEAGNELLRILTGPRFAIGLADIAALKQYAQTQQKTTNTQHQNTQVIEDPETEFSLVDALDTLAGKKTPKIKAVTPAGLKRLTEAAHTLKELRQNIRLETGELIWHTVRKLRLDTELVSNESRNPDPAAALQNIHTFVDYVRAYGAGNSRASLGTLLEWLQKAATRDEQPEYTPKPQPNTVQLLTVHGAKGLEWDHVVIAELSKNEFPTTRGLDQLSLEPYAIPDEHKKHSLEYVGLAWRQANTQTHLLQLAEQVRTNAKTAKNLEDLRLFYVAITRAKQDVLAVGSYWAGTLKTVRGPSNYIKYFTEKVTPDENSIAKTNPLAREEQTVLWPQDPLGTRRKTVEDAAAMVLTALKTGDSNPPSKMNPIIKQIANTKNTQENLTPQTENQTQINSSTFAKFIANPHEYEKKRVRPIPRKPSSQAAIGTIFHEWVETRNHSNKSENIHNKQKNLTAKQKKQLQTLQEHFTQSRWAKHTPTHSELQIRMNFAGKTLVCKIDAVYGKEITGKNNHYLIVDWKTGKTPNTAQKKDDVLLQIQLYRHALAAALQIPATNIEALLYYVQEQTELQPQNYLSIQELTEKWQQAQAKLA